MADTFVLTLKCPDRIGIVAVVVFVRRLYLLLCLHTLCLPAAEPCRRQNVCKDDDGFDVVPNFDADCVCFGDIRRELLLIRCPRSLQSKVKATMAVICFLISIGLGRSAPSMTVSTSWCRR